MTTRKMKAWLVTWEWTGDHAKRPTKVAEVLDPRFPPERVRRIVELLYAHETYTLAERIAWCLLDKKKNPYPAKFVELEGLPWSGQIHCGHNPFLVARLVDDLVVKTDAQGRETATWKDRHKPSEIRKKIAAFKSEHLTL
jgi:hypothetical protein